MMKKSLKVAGLETPAEVKITEEAHGGVEVFRFTVTCGETVHEATHTIGADAGEIGDYTPESLQAELDERAAHFAEHAGRREKFRLAKAAVKAAAEKAGPKP